MVTFLSPSLPSLFLDLWGSYYLTSADIPLELKTTKHGNKVSFLSTDKILYEGFMYLLFLFTPVVFSLRSKLRLL